MSYDLEVRSDASYSKFIARDHAVNVLTAQSNVKETGPTSLAFDEPPGQWMEIDLEVVDDEGNWIEADTVPEKVNCLRFHVPYGFLKDGTEIEAIYLPIVSRVAEVLGWTVFYDSTQLRSL